MKLKLYFVLAIFSAFAACKTTYKATDRPTALTDSTSSVTDSASTLSKIDSIRMPIPPDSTSITAKPDSIRMPAKPDSTRMPTPPDSTTAKPDSTKISPVADSTSMPAKADSTKISRVTDSTKISPPDKTPSTGVSVSAETRAAFTKQYPGATNDVWTNYDSLAAVPIDLRMAGWKRMDAEDHLVKFDLENENYYAWYDSDGNWVGSAYTMKDPSKLPAAVNAAVKNAVKTKYAGYSITNVNREFQKDKKAYEIELKKDNSTVKMLVNADGKIIKVFKYVKEITK
jgi:uncharacterized membrane protein YkoI